MCSAEVQVEPISFVRRSAIALALGAMLLAAAVTAATTATVAVAAVAAARGGAERAQGPPPPGMGSSSWRGRA